MAQWWNLHLETRKFWEVVGSNPTEPSCWARVPQVCSDLPRNREQPDAAYGSLALKARYLSVRQLHDLSIKLQNITSIWPSYGLQHIRYITSLNTGYKTWILISLDSVRASTHYKPAYVVIYKPLTFILLLTIIYLLQACIRSNL